MEALGWLRRVVCVPFSPALPIRFRLRQSAKAPKLPLHPSSARSRPQILSGDARQPLRRERHSGAFGISCLSSAVLPLNLRIA
eukprot:scaffold5143_cov231-Pinguiococcus_pyrenoidosus.AAC.7